MYRVKFFKRNGHKSSVYQVPNTLFTNQSSVRNYHKMTNCEQFWTKCSVKIAATLKVLDQITLVNKFCLNFKIKVSFHLSSSSKVKKLQIYILFWRSRRKWRLCYLLFYWVWLHFAIYSTRFWLFLRKYPILERQISGCEWETYQPSIGTKISKTLR